MLIKEREMYKMNNERMLRENDHLKDFLGVIMNSTKLLTHGESSQAKDHWEGSSAYSQGKYDVLVAVIKKRQVSLTTWLNKLWGTHSHNFVALREHERMDGRILEKLQEINQRNVSDNVAIEAANHLVNKHRDFFEEL